MRALAKFLRGATTLTFVVGCPSAYAGEVETQVKQNIALFDELLECASEPSFRKFGLASGGPCSDWDQRVASEQGDGVSLIANGYDCVAGDIRIAGNSLVSGDAVSFARVTKRVRECENKLQEAP